MTEQQTKKAVRTVLEGFDSLKRKIERLEERLAPLTREYIIEDIKGYEALITAIDSTYEGMKRQTEQLARLLNVSYEEAYALSDTYMYDSENRKAIVLQYCY